MSKKKHGDNFDVHDKGYGKVEADNIHSYNILLKYR